MDCTEYSCPEHRLLAPNANPGRRKELMYFKIFFSL